jgi:hypothetical protein
MWKTFWGGDLSKIQPSNRKNVVPGAWRVEVSPAQPAQEDFFLHVFEIGKIGIAGRRTELIDGVNFVGAASESGPFALFAKSDSAALGGEVYFPNLACESLIVSGLQPDTVYELSFTGPNVAVSPESALPGVLIDMLRLRSNSKGLMRLDRPCCGDLNLRIARV